MKILNKIKYYTILIFDPKIYSMIYIKLLLLLVLSIIRIRYNYFFIEHDLILNFLRIGITYLILNLFFNYFRLIVIYFYLRKNKLSKEHFDNYILGINKISFFLNHFVFILVIVHLFIINLKELLTGISLVAVAIVLIFKDYISNFINGILIMFSDEISLRDYVKIGDYKGRVSNLTLKNIELTTENGDYVYIPNTVAFSKEITNFSKGSIKVVRQEFSVQNIYYSKYPKIKMEIFNAIYNNYSEIITNRDNINIRIDRNDKDQFYILFDIIVTKYNYKIELNLKNFISEKMIEILSNK